MFLCDWIATGLDRRETSIYRRQTVPQAEAQDCIQGLCFLTEDLTWTAILCSHKPSLPWRAMSSRTVVKINASYLSCFCQLFCNEINYLVQVMECKDIALKLNTCLVWTQYLSPPKNEQWQRNRVKPSINEECPSGHRWWGPNKDLSKIPMRQH